jgi:type IV secretory pathway TrbL component
VSQSTMWWRTPWNTMYTSGPLLWHRKGSGGRVATTGATVVACTVGAAETAVGELATVADGAGLGEAAAVAAGGVWLAAGVVVAGAGVPQLDSSKAATISKNERTRNLVGTATRYSAELVLRIIADPGPMLKVRNARTV